MLAILRQREDLVKLFLSKNLPTDLTVSSHNYMGSKSPLQLAIEYSIPSADIVELLLKHGKSNLNHFDSNHNTPLASACTQSEPSSINKLEMLLRYASDGINPNTRNNQGVSPLLLCNNLSLDKTRMLGMYFKHRLDISIVDNQGASVIHHAAESNRIDALHVLLNLARQSGQIDLVLEQRVPESGNTPLHLACKYSGFVNNKAAVALLVNLGPESIANSVNKVGYTPLMLAVNNFATANNEAVIDLLVNKAGVKVDIRNSIGETVIDMARNRGRHNLAQYLSCHMEIKPLEKEETE